METDDLPVPCGVFTAPLIPADLCLPGLFPMEQLFLRMLRRRKSITTICLLADIDGLKDGDSNLLKKEIKELGGFREFIVHNSAMQEWLKRQIPGRQIPVTQIEFFDFLTAPVFHDRHKSQDIVFAGNLEKSGFLNQLDTLANNPTSSSLHFHLYGPGRTASIQKQANVNWLGTYSPYELPTKLEGSFGLVWDGEAIDHPGGSLGEYMRYITHHKVSLYILSGLPLIVPRMAGSANLVERYGIGLFIDKLDEIGEKIDALSEQEYQQMRENMKPLAEKISQGLCLSQAMDRL